MRNLAKHLEKFIEETENYLAESVTNMLKQDIPALSEEKFALFETTGNRLIYEQDYFAKRKFLTVFGVAAQWMKQEKQETLGGTTKQALLMKLEKILLCICEEECWALPAHVNRRDNPDWRNTIDLFAAETAQALADIVDNVGTDLSSQCVTTVQENVWRRVLQPFFEAPVNSYGWEQADHNWNAVCNGCIGSAYLHSQKQENTNPQYLKRITENLLYYLDGFAADGTCMEGLGYYFYGMTYMVNFAEELYENSAGEIDLLRGSWGGFKVEESDKRTRIAAWWSKCFFASGRTVSFSDGDSREKYRMGLACALATRFEEVQLPDSKQALALEEDACYRYLPFKLDIFCTKYYLEQLRKQTQTQGETHHEEQAKAYESRCTVLQDAQWCIGEASLQQAGFACKGGHNGEPHNHNDVGSFLYVSGEDMFLADLGAGEYTKEYFSEGRYHILCNRSLGHNIPIIDGKEQLTGAVYGCEHFEVTETKWQVQVIMELTKVYEASKLKNFTRKITFQKDDAGLTIEDIFESSGQITITENLVTQYRPEIEGNSIVLIGKNGTCHLQVVFRNKRERDCLRVVPMEHSNHQGEPEQVYLVQWDRSIEGKYKELIKIELI